MDSALPLVEGIDYRLENGLLVFTAAYHLRRGSCCHSGCRHCPWKAERDAPGRDAVNSSSERTPSAPVPPSIRPPA